MRILLAAGALGGLYYLVNSMKNTYTSPDLLTDIIVHPIDHTRLASKGGDRSKYPAPEPAKDFVVADSPDQYIARATSTMVHDYEPNLEERGPEGHAVDRDGLYDPYYADG